MNTRLKARTGLKPIICGGLPYRSEIRFDRSKVLKDLELLAESSDSPSKIQELPLTKTAEEKPEITGKNGYQARAKNGAKNKNDSSAGKARSDGSKGSPSDSAKQMKGAATQKSDAAKEQQAVKGLSRLRKLLWEEASKSQPQGQSPKMKAPTNPKKRKYEKIHKKNEIQPIDPIPEIGPLENIPSASTPAPILPKEDSKSIITQGNIGINIGANIRNEENGNIFNQFVMRMEKAGINPLYLMNNPILNIDPAISLISSKTTGSTSSISNGEKKFAFRRANWHGFIAYRIKNYKENEIEGKKSEAIPRENHNFLIENGDRNHEGIEGISAEDYNKAVELLTTKKEPMAGIKNGIINGLGQ